jgi:hypothetical protein
MVAPAQPNGPLRASKIEIVDDEGMTMIAMAVRHGAGEISVFSKNGLVATVGVAPNSTAGRVMLYGEDLRNSTQLAVSTDCTDVLTATNRVGEGCVRIPQK